MNKYFEIFRTTLGQYFVYRLNFIVWRIRNLLNLFLIYFFWSSVYYNRQVGLGYSTEMIITYVILIFLLSDLLLSYNGTDIAGDILNGNIINQLLKPVSFIKTLLTKDIAIKMLNIIFAIGEIIIFISLVKPTLFLSMNIVSLTFFLVSLVIGLFLSFFLSLSLSLIAFWTPEVWAPRFMYYIFTTFLGGFFFPLDLLPPVIYKILLLTPFPYIMFIPSQIYLRGINYTSFLLLGVGVLWTIFAYYLTMYIWKKGLQEFSFYGR